MHMALYAFLVCMPLLGWLVVSAKGKPVPFVGALWHHYVMRDDTLLHMLPGVSDSLGADVVRSLPRA
ncbi:hypothetical protein MASR1M50_11980 [Burkholderiales bacterium]